MIYIKQISRSFIIIVYHRSGTEEDYHELCQLLTDVDELERSCSSRPKEKKQKIGHPSLGKDIRDLAMVSLKQKAEISPAKAASSGMYEILK